MSLADYLAKNYLTSSHQRDPTSSSKKRKRRVPSEHAKSKSKSTRSATTQNLSGLTIDSSDSDSRPHGSAGDEDDEDAPTVVGSAGGGLHVAGAAAKKQQQQKSRWIKVGASAPSNAEQAAADSVLATARAEANAYAAEDEEAPAIVEGGGAGEKELEEEEDGEPMMASGARAGLQSGAEVSAALRKREKAERRKALEAMGGAADGKASETIYRDASGRVVNVAMKRAEMRSKIEEEERKKKEEVEGRKGDVQLREKAERKRELERAREMGVARHADDEQMNDELRARERWNDPMAALVAKSGGAGKKKGKAGKTYQGAFEPNRYGIRPGWKWDGVDRGNGFERKWFAARNKAKDRQELEYAWQIDE